MYKCKYDFKDILLVLHQILTRVDPDDFLLYSTIGIYLGSLCEDEGEFRVSVQVLWSTLSKIIEERERLMQVTQDFKENPNTSKYITVDNLKISEIEEQILLRVRTWEKLIERRERDRKRKVAGAPELEEDEGDEEAYEFDRLQESLNERSLIERHVQKEQWEKEKKEREKCYKTHYDQT